MNASTLVGLVVVAATALVPLFSATEADAAGRFEGTWRMVSVGCTDGAQPKFRDYALALEMRGGRAAVITNVGGCVQRITGYTVVTTADSLTLVDEGHLRNACSPAVCRGAMTILQGDASVTREFSCVTGSPFAPAPPDVFFAIGPRELRRDEHHEGGVMCAIFYER